MKPQLEFMDKNIVTKVLAEIANKQHKTIMKCELESNLSLKQNRVSSKLLENIVG